MKPNMVSGGSESLTKLNEMDIAAYTIRTLQRTVPVAVSSSFEFVSSSWHPSDHQILLAPTEHSPRMCSEEMPVTVVSAAAAYVKELRYI